jgi:glyoxylate/hydroxypyruvate reductase A
VRCGPILIFSPEAGVATEAAALINSARPDLVVRYASDAAAAIEALPGIEVLYGWGFPKTILANPPSMLRWIQKMGAGGEDVLQEVALSNRLLTRTPGAPIAATMSDYVAAAVLNSALRTFDGFEQQRRRHWEEYPVRSVEGGLVGVAGLGDIGNVVASRLLALGMTVRGWRRSETKGASTFPVYSGAPAFSDFLAGLQWLVLVLPLTSETRNIIDASALAKLAKGAHLVNVGRGELVNTDALCAAVQSGHIGGATLDVIDPEPLPQGHPLWDIPGIVVTPHVAGPLLPSKVVPYFLENIQRYESGKPL